MRPQHLAERFVQEMRRRMMRARRRAARVIDVERDLLAQFQRAGLDHALMQKQAVQLLLRVLDGEARGPSAGDGAAVADLAAGFGIERRLIDDDDAALALL